MEGIVVRRVIPSDNSCLFNAVGWVSTLCWFLLCGDFLNCWTIKQFMYFLSQICDGAWQAESCRVETGFYWLSANEVALHFSGFFSSVLSVKCFIWPLNSDVHENLW